MIEVGQLVVDDVQPAEPVLLVAAGPQRRIAFPQTLDLAVDAPVVEGGLHRCSDWAGQGSRLTIYFFCGMLFCAHFGSFEIGSSESSLLLSGFRIGYATRNANC